MLGDSGASSHISHKKKDTNDVKKCEINVTVGNGQKMKCELKGSVNMKLKDGQTVKLTRKYRMTMCRVLFPIDAHIFFSSSIAL